MKRQPLYILAWTALCAAVAFGDQTVDIQGRVVTSTRQPVPGATVGLLKGALSCITAQNGLFHLTGSVGIAAPGGAAQAVPRGIDIRAKYLELGVVTDATVSAYSTRGALLNRVAVMKASRIPVARIIPPAVSSQMVVLVVAAGGRSTEIRAVRCGGGWLWNAAFAARAVKSGVGKSAELFAVDSLVVAKAGMQTTMQGVKELTGSVDDIVMWTLAEAAPGSSGLIGDVTFSEPSKTFKTPIAVTMSTAIAGATIRYTIDGGLPTAASTAYAGSALSIGSTTQLRAAAFLDTITVGRPSTALYVARAIDVTSDIPIIVMDDYGYGKPSTDKSTYLDAAFLVFEPKNGTASLANAPTVATRAGFHLRGQSSMMFPQAPYKVELRDNDDKDAAYQLLGMPWGSDWALISPYSDNSLIRNVFAFELGAKLGLATMHYRFAEVYLVTDAAPLDTSHYQGVYTLTQTIRNQKGRLNLKQLHPGDIDTQDISGGYILKFDQLAMDVSKTEIECTGAKKMSTTGSIFGPSKNIDSTATCWDDLEIEDPPAPNSQQVAWITAYCQRLHDALHASPAGDWKQYIDMKSFVNMFILNEITRNVDSWIRSAYMYKERGRPLTSGPVWDYNFALDNYSTDTVGWHVEENRRGYNDWHTRLWRQSEFRAAVRARWEALRPGILSDASVAGLIDKVRAPIVNAAERDLQKWPIGQGSLFGGMFPTDTLQPKTWSGQIDLLKSWTKKRMKSLDSSMATLPK